MRTEYLNSYLPKLLTGIKSNDPLKMAVITYHAVRESPLVMKLKAIDKKAYDKTALLSITNMMDILKKLEWESDNIEKFSEHCKELWGLTK